MVDASKGHFFIANTSINISVLIEYHNEELFDNDEEFINSNTASKIATEAFIKSDAIAKTFPSLDKRYFQHVYVESDDTYVGTLDDADERGKTNTSWHENYLTLFEERVVVEHDGVSYPCEVQLFRLKFKDEKSDNVQ